MTPSEMSTTRAPSIVNTEVDKASVAATSAIEIPEFADSVRDTGEDKKLSYKNYCHYHKIIDKFYLI